MTDFLPASMDLFAHDEHMPALGMWAPYGTLVIPSYEEYFNPAVIAPDMGLRAWVEFLASPVVVNGAGGSVTGPITDDGPTPGLGPYTPRLEPAPGGGYDIVIPNPDDPGGPPLVVGHLPDGADPNAPFTIILDGRMLLILYGGLVLIVYLIPLDKYEELLSNFWIGFRDAVTGEPTDPPPGYSLPGAPPDHALTYRLDMAVRERPLGFKHTMLLRATRPAGDDVLVMPDGSVKRGRFLSLEDVKAARVVVLFGRRSPDLSYEDALDLYEGGVGDKLVPVI